MKNFLVIITFLFFSVISVKAQTQPQQSQAMDSISVLFQNLVRTNAEVDYLNECLRLHSQIALVSFAVEVAGGALLLLSTKRDNPYQAKNLKSVGIGLGIVGAIGFIGSYIPIWTKKIHLNEQGLVIDLP